MKIAVATSNLAKLREIEEIMSDVCQEVVSVDSLIGHKLHVIEDGKTFSANARKKAISGYLALRKLGLFDYIVFADDSGLCVEALDGAPGVHSARYATKEGGSAGDSINRQKLLKDMQGVSHRDAYFVSCFCVYGDNTDIVVEGKTYGEILKSEVGENGFGYDSIFYSHSLGKSFGEASAEEKNKESHRAKALNEVKRKLK